MSVGWDVLMVPCVRDNNPLGTQKISSKNRLVRAARKHSKIQSWSFFTNHHRRYLAEIMPIRRKTLSNQSINQSVLQNDKTRDQRH